MASVTAKPSIVISVPVATARGVGVVPEVVQSKPLEALIEVIRSHPGDDLRVIRIEYLGPHQFKADVLNESGEVVDSGVGDNHEDAILELAEALQPKDPDQGP